MKLYVGGAYQGQDELARRENPGATLLTDFHETIRQAHLRGDDPKAFARALTAERPDAVVVTNEVGSGVVPIDPGERAWREAVGRALCVIAQAADQVVYVTCGIGVRIK